MAARTFKASALKRVAQKPATKISDIAGKPGPLFGSRMLVTDYCASTKEWSAPTITDYGDLAVGPQVGCLHYGLTAFDHMLVCRDHATSGLRAFRPDKFLARLARSRDYLHFEQYDNDELFACIKEVIKEDEPSVPTAQGQSYVLRTCLLGMNTNLSAGPADNIKLYTFGVLVDGARARDKPLRVYADPFARRSWRGGTGEYAMGGNYANQIFVEQQSRSKGYDSNLFLVDNGVITTVGASNFFTVLKRLDGTLEVVTPALDGTTMPGVVRECVLELARKMPDVTVTEGSMTMDDLKELHREGKLLEAFGTSTPAIQPISTIHYAGVDLDVATPSNGLSTELRSAILKRQTGEIPSDWSVLL